MNFENGGELMCTFSTIFYRGFRTAKLSVDTVLQPTYPPFGLFYSSYSYESKEPGSIMCDVTATKRRIRMSSRRKIEKVPNSPCYLLAVEILDCTQRRHINSSSLVVRSECIIQKFPKTACNLLVVRILDCTLRRHIKTVCSGETPDTQWGCALQNYRKTTCFLLVVVILDGTPKAHARNFDPECSFFMLPLVSGLYHVLFVRHEETTGLSKWLHTPRTLCTGLYIHEAPRSLSTGNTIQFQIRIRRKKFFSLIAFLFHSCFPQSRVQILHKLYCIFIFSSSLTEYQPF